MFNANEDLNPNNLNQRYCYPYKYNTVAECFVYSELCPYGFRKPSSIEWTSLISHMRQWVWVTDCTECGAYVWFSSRQSSRSLLVVVAAVADALFLPVPSRACNYCYSCFSEGYFTWQEMWGKGTIVSSFLCQWSHRALARNISILSDIIILIFERGKKLSAVIHLTTFTILSVLMQQLNQLDALI